ncbi:MAG: hypothetical protein ACHQDB_01010 [Steroidobacterales bacterium]
MSPFTWSELWAEGDLPQAVRDVIEMGRQRGWHEGLAVPIHGPGVISDWSRLPAAL